MFSAFCEHCGYEVLLSSRRIEALGQGPEGIFAVFRCWVGHLGVWHARPAAPAPPALAAA